MKSKKPPLRPVKTKPKNVIRIPGTEPPEEILREVLDHVLDPGSDVTAVLICTYDSRTGFNFSSTAMSPETHCLFAMELEQRIRHHMLTQYFRKPPDGSGA